MILDSNKNNDYCRIAFCVRTKGIIHYENENIDSDRILYDFVVMKERIKYAILEDASNAMDALKMIFDFVSCFHEEIEVVDHHKDCAFVPDDNHHHTKEKVLIFTI